MGAMFRFSAIILTKFDPSRRVPMCGESVSTKSRSRDNLTATSATELEPTGVLEGSGGIQGETASNLDDLLTKQGIGTLRLLKC